LPDSLNAKVHDETSNTILLHILLAGFKKSERSAHEPALKRRQNDLTLILVEKEISNNLTRKFLSSSLLT